jgi:hypothetical protein
MTQQCQLSFELPPFTSCSLQALQEDLRHHKAVAAQAAAAAAMQGMGPAEAKRELDVIRDKALAEQRTKLESKRKLEQAAAHVGQQEEEEAGAIEAAGSQHHARLREQPATGAPCRPCSLVACMHTALPGASRA